MCRRSRRVRSTGLLRLRRAIRSDHQFPNPIRARDELAAASSVRRVAAPAPVQAGLQLLRDSATALPARAQARASAPAPRCRSSPRIRRAAARTAHDGFSLTTEGWDGRYRPYEDAWGQCAQLLEGDPALGPL